ncbi:hypothetical protein [Pelagivirga sediminicola]|nr:hypothetical protein [Pelagivirga sediminicola]
MTAVQFVVSRLRRWSPRPDALVLNMPSLLMKDGVTLHDNLRVTRMAE